ncbi:MAG TPA: hypothetical protein DCL74_01275 [Succinivibrionaceae bacterium]|nr:hypothetical protein [Succinivibrionaceae bacterium]
MYGDNVHKTKKLSIFVVLTYMNLKKMLSNLGMKKSFLVIQGYLKCGQKALGKQMLFFICHLFGLCGGLFMKLSVLVKILFTVLAVNAATISSGFADDLCFEKSVFELQDEFNSGKLSSVQLVDYYLKRIKVYDGLINAMITVNPKAMEEAKRLDEERAQGHIEGPLHGIPIVLKDNYDTFDMPTTSGALGF